MAITVPAAGTKLSVSAFGKPVADQLNLLAPTAWVTPTLQNGWSNLGGVWQVVQYRKVGDIVYLRGHATATALTGTWAFFTLPAGFRPPAQISLPSVGAGGGALITIFADGLVAGGAYPNSPANWYSNMACTGSFSIV